MDNQEMNTHIPNIVFQNSSQSFTVLQSEDKMAHSNYTEGPLTMLTESIRDNKKVVIEIGNQYQGSIRKLIANIVAYDKDFNMVLRNIIEIWSTKCIRTGKWVPRERFVAKMFFTRQEC